MDREEIVQIIREALLKYTDPKPKYTGFNAQTVAEIIYEQINEVNNE